MTSEWTKRQRRVQEKLFAQSRRILEEIEALREKARKLLKRQAESITKARRFPK